jgi:enamine deaminase RidA (YjgF/YER057c/UK114 family)
MTHEVIKPEKGYANGIVATGRLLFVAGQVGWDEKHVFAEGFAAQFDRALANVMEVVSAAGGKAESIARMTIYVTDKRQYNDAVKNIGSSWKARLGRWYPAMTLVEVKSLLEDKALLELEATAVLS